MVYKYLIQVDVPRLVWVLFTALRQHLKVWHKPSADLSNYHYQKYFIFSSSPIYFKYTFISVVIYWYSNIFDTYFNTTSIHVYSWYCIQLINKSYKSLKQTMHCLKTEFVNIEVLFTEEEEKLPYLSLNIQQSCLIMQTRPI